MNENQTIKALVKVIDADNIHPVTKKIAGEKLLALVEGVNNPTELFNKLELLDIQQPVCDATAYRDRLQRQGSGYTPRGFERDYCSSFDIMLSTLNNLLSKHTKNKGE